MYAKLQIGGLLMGEPKLCIPLSNSFIMLFKTHEGNEYSLNGKIIREGFDHWGIGNEV